MLFVFLLAVTAGQCFGMDVVQTLVADPEESKLVSLVTEAGLAGPLSNGDFTVFAPTNDAFAKVPQATLDSLSADTTALANLLKYHVISGKVRKADVRNEQTVATLAGDKLRINIYTHNDVVTVEGVPVSDFDKLADNGVIHKLTGVIMPPSGSIVDLVAGNSDFSTLLTAVTKAGIVDALKADRLTVFAPTNAAFAKVRSEDLNKILGNADILRDVLTYHVVDHTLYSAGLYDRELPHSIDSHHDRLLVHVRSSTGVTINNVAKVTTADISTTNGVVHVIDHVLIPLRVQIWLRTGIIG